MSERVLAIDDLEKAVPEVGKLAAQGVLTPVAQVLPPEHAGDAHRMCDRTACAADIGRHSPGGRAPTCPRTDQPCGWVRLSAGRVLAELWGRCDVSGEGCFGNLRGGLLRR